MQIKYLIYLLCVSKILVCLKMEDQILDIQATSLIFKGLNFLK
jgi:hypothetical protein